jgi:mono/diheme cytochrome c family protein
VISITVVALLAAGGWATGDAARIARGKAVYEQACAQCHGQDGNGNPEWESQVRPVEFSDCGTTAEPSDLWQHIVKHGGPSAGLNSVMPAFGEAYADQEIADVVAYLRTFCTNADRYPPGDLNFRRLLKTGKAFPEQEVVLRAGHAPKNEESGTASETELELVYENRIGPRFQYEVALPLTAQSATGAGIGDVELELKHVLAFSHRSLSIVSAGLGTAFPTGNEAKDHGSGTFSFSPFVAFGKGFGRGRTFFQAKMGAELPTDQDKADPEVTYAAGLSHSFGMSRKAFVPAIEFAGSYNTKTKTHDYGVWVELSKPLNPLGHVIASVGAQIPIRPKSASWRLEAYVLWDFGDGPIWSGW